mgnify:CR=1 FL=1
MNEIYLKKMEEQEIRESDEYLKFKNAFLSITADYTIKDYIENLKFLIKLHKRNKIFKTKEIKIKILAYEDLLEEAKKKF